MPQTKYTDTELLDALEQEAREEPLTLHALQHLDPDGGRGYRGLGLMFGGTSRSLRDAIAAAFMHRSGARSTPTGDSNG